MAAPLIFTLNGAYFRSDSTREFVKSISDPIVCVLVKDPSNRYDRNAIKVMYGDCHLGFVPREFTHLVPRNYTPCKVTWNPDNYYKPYVIVD
jgi:hypothetical protein